MTSADDNGEEVLSDEIVGAAWEQNPTLTLLRGYSARWVLPLFSQHLEFADGPVSADWFHQKVADARARYPEWVGDVSPAEHCKNWVDNRWLVRRRPRAREAAIQYRLSPHALRALRIVREVIKQENTVSEARLGSISNAVRKLADMTDPSREAQLARVDTQISELRRRREEIVEGRIRAATVEEMKRQLREVVRLTSSLPEDFRQLSAMVEQRHREVARRASVDNVGKGALVEEYLRQNDLLDQTPEGRAYRGFAQALTTREVETLWVDIDQILSQDFARREMTTRQQTQLEGLVSSLLVEEHSVQETYLRWTASLRRFLTRSVGGRHQRLLALADEALTAGLEWIARRPGHAAVPDVLGVGPLDLKDVSQMQLWRDPGPRTVQVTVEKRDLSLPEADRAALRLAAGTSPAAVAVTINALLRDREHVTGREVYDATLPTYQRLGTVLSLLDLGVAYGKVVADTSEMVTLRSEHGHDLEIAMPQVVFDRPLVLGRVTA